ncbi:MAG: thiol-disulfide oxidoreductase DCC family protein [Phycisphaerae bacterium]
MTSSETNAATQDARPVVVYDGSCPFCLKQVARLNRRDRNNALEFLPKQTPGLSDRFPQLADMDFEKGLRFVTPDGSVSVGSDGVYEIARRVSLYRNFAWLYRVPGLHQLFRGLYAWVAKNRYKLAGSCETGTCDVGAPRDDAAVSQEFR